MEKDISTDSGIEAYEVDATSYRMQPGWLLSMRGSSRTASQQPGSAMPPTTSMPSSPAEERPEETSEDSSADDL